MVARFDATFHSPDQNSFYGPCLLVFLFFPPFLFLARSKSKLRARLQHGGRSEKFKRRQSSICEFVYPVGPFCVMIVIK